MRVMVRERDKCNESIYACVRVGTEVDEYYSVVDGFLGGICVYGKWFL